MRLAGHRRALRGLGLALAVALAAGVLVLSSRAHNPAVQEPSLAVRPATVPSTSRSPAKSARSSHHRAAPRAPQQRGLSIDQVAGQRVIYAYAGATPPPSLFSVIHAGEAAGVILFGDNILSLQQVHSVIDQLQRARLTSPVQAPLLVLVDQEGGEVRRLPGPPLQSEKRVGESPQALEIASRDGMDAGGDLARAGVNVNLAPVLDVYEAHGNFIDQYQRSYSSDPTVAAQLGAAFIEAQQAMGVAATAKHFPGLGSARQDQNTDLGPVVLSQSLSHLRSVDETPFQTAISAGVKLVMLSWAIYPALDPHRPAGLSTAVIQSELRRRLAFGGVTITDGIDAGAVTPFGNLASRTVQAAAAGDDLILAATTNPDENAPAVGLSVLHALAAAMTSHLITHAASQQAVDRIIALRMHP